MKSFPGRLLPFLLVSFAFGASSGQAFGFVTLGATWPRGTVGFKINPNFPDTALSGSPDEQVAFVLAAAGAWRDQSRAAFQFQYLGTTTVHQLNENDGVNAVFWSDADGGDALAITLFSGKGGVTTSADITFFNSSHGFLDRWSGPGEPPVGTFDIRGVATHELGHVLGLGHTPVTDATMFASASGRALAMRTLAPDDTSGVESLYGLRDSLPPAVEITSVGPSSGPAVGGNEVVLQGVNFTYSSDTALWIDGAALSRAFWDVESYTTLRILQMPPHPRGAVSIRVENTIGEVTLGNAYSYVGVPFAVLSIDPKEGPSAGGIVITVTGRNFAPGALVKIGGKPLVAQTLVDSGTITGTLPPGSTDGPVDVGVEEGADASVLAAAFSYNSYLLRLGDQRGAPGQEALSMEVQVTSPVPLAAISFGISYDGALLSVREVSVAGTQAASAQLASASIDNLNGITTFEMVMSSDQPTPVFPDGTGVPLAHVLLDLAAGARPGTSVGLQFKDGVGSPPVAMVFTRAGDRAQVKPLAEDGNLIVEEGAVFVRGDSNGDGKVDISDAIYLLSYLFRGGPAVGCREAADSNDDGTLDISDAVKTLLFLFKQAPPPDPPYPGRGPDPTVDGLGCGP